MYKDTCAKTLANHHETNKNNKPTTTKNDPQIPQPDLRFTTKQNSEATKNGAGPNKTKRIQICLRYSDLSHRMKSNADIEASSDGLLYQIEVHNGLIPAYIVKKHQSFASASGLSRTMAMISPPSFWIRAGRPACICARIATVLFSHRVRSHSFRALARGCQFVVGFLSCRCPQCTDEGTVRQCGRRQICDSSYCT